MARRPTDSDAVLTSRRELLAGAASLALCGGLTSTAHGAVNGRPAKNLLVFFAYGGWDTAMCFDPKPGVSTVIVPDGEVQTHHGIDIYAVDGAPAVPAFFAEHGDQVALLRGLDMVSLSHEICRRYALTGTADIRQPDLAAIIAATTGVDRALPYLMMSSRAMPGPLAGLAGWLGRGNQLGELLNPDLGVAPLPDLGLPPDDAIDPVSDWIRGRHERSAAEFHSSKGKARYDDFGAGQDRVASLEAHREGFRGFEGLEIVDNQIDMALHVLANGLVRSVMVDSGNNWDTHYDNDLQVRYYDRMFTALDRLMTGLRTTPGLEGGTLYDETVVWVVSEMGRPPGMNEGYGKEHLPFTSSLLMGGGVKSGQVIGATDDRLVGQRVNLQTGALDDGGSLVRPDQLVAGLLEGCGVSAEPYLPNVTPFMGPFEDA